MQEIRDDDGEITMEGGEAHLGIERTLHPTPYTLHPTPYTLPPTPSTLKLTIFS